jgi:hypothetical protein
VDIKEADKDPSLFKNSKKKKNGRTIVVDFSDDFRVLVDEKSSDNLVDKVADDYRTRGSTALYDAIGEAFKMVDKDDEKVFVNIITDGEENASRKFSGAMVKELIEGKKSKGWAILFLGTDENCINAAQNLGVSRGSTMTFNAQGGYSGMSGMVGKEGYSGTLAYARTAYMSSSNLVADDNLLERAEEERLSTDKKLGIIPEELEEEVTK